MALNAKEQRTLAAIVVGSENDPHRPEFPPGKPCFPATPTYRISVPGFSNVWLKDESANPTGTHKDRMAWEMVVTYRDLLMAKKAGTITTLPHLSLISSGSAAFAIQTQLRTYGLPALHVLMDRTTDPDIIHVLAAIGCRIFLHDLSRKMLNWQDILRITHNERGFDITSNEAYDPAMRFYDWLSYEILNHDAQYIFVPFGTGHLYENIMNRVKRELTSRSRDPRFRGTKKTLRGASFLGATTTDPKSKAVKLYAPFLPFAHCSAQWMRFYRSTGLTGVLSDVYSMKESYLDQALALACEQRIQCEPSGIAGLALLLQMKKRIPRSAKILIVNTGKTKYPCQF